MTNAEDLQCGKQEDTAVETAQAFGEEGAAFSETGAPRVTVLIVTYNHRDYIEAAVESALAQQTSFPVEVLISEDASTDGTRDIVARYAERFPARVRPLPEWLPKGPRPRRQPPASEEAPCAWLVAGSRCS